jgi:hypothetical protein
MRQLTIERAAAIILFALLFAMAARIPNDTDTWWHLRSADYILSHGFIYADPFSFTKLGQPWIDHSWGSQLILYGFWKLGGNFGLAIYTAALATAGMYLVYRMCEGNVYLRAFAVVLGAATAAVFWSARPQMLSFFLSTVILYLLYLYRRKKVDRLWLIPPIMAVWGNLHAGFSIGFIFLLGTIAGEVLANIFSRDKAEVIPWRGIGKLALVTLISAAALVINPYGLQMLGVPFQTVSIGALQNFIQEWNSPNFHGRETWPFIALLLGLIGAAGASSKRMAWTDFVLCAGTAFMALLAGRNIAVFAVVATPVLTIHLNSALTDAGLVLQPVRRVTRTMARLNLILVIVVIIGALAKVLLVLNAKTVTQAQMETLPVRVTEYLNTAQPSGPMFNSYNWGGYLTFFAPQYPVYVDGRTDLYGDKFLTDYLQAATGGPNWRSLLDQDGINLVVVETGSGLALNLAEEPGWQKVYPPADSDDTMAVIFVREAAVHGGS